MLSKIDVSRDVNEMERTLRATTDPARRRPLLSVLSRWQHDERLDDASRERARRLVDEFGKAARLP